MVSLLSVDVAMMRPIQKNFICFSLHYFSAAKVVTVRGVRNFGAFWRI